jgi:hypothetical protein
MSTPAGSVARMPSVRRGILLGLLLQIPNSYWVVTSEAVQFGPYLTTLSLFANALFWLVLLVAASALLRRLRPQWALHQGDLLVAYSMLAAGSAITGCDLLQILMHYIGHPTWAGGGAWAQFIPTWLTVTDPDAVKGYYEGNAPFYRWTILRAWAGPLAAWMLFIALLATAAICLNALLRRLWADHERLTFPLVWLPIAMSDPSQRMWRNRLFWVGALLAGGIDLWNGIAFLYPWLPSVPTNWLNLEPFLPDKPWSALGFTTISFYPMIIGVGYLLPLDLLFSFWFFYLFWKAQLVITSAQGWDITPRFPYVGQQGFGALLVIGLVTLWNARRHLARIRRRLFSRDAAREDAGEAVSYRAATIALIGSVAGLMLFLRLMGIQGWAAAAFLGIYLLTILTVTRIRAEFGAPVHDLPNAAPELVLTDVLGPGAFTPRDLAGFSMFYWISKIHRSDFMPHGMEALKIADNERVGRRAMFFAVLAAILVGALAGFWAMLHQGYALGNAARWSFPAYAGWETFNRLDQWLASPTLPEPAISLAILIGALCCSALIHLRHVFFAFPLHPLGYAIAGTFQTNLFWLPLLIAWGVKLAVLRTGGRALYLRLLPFAYGLILGQVAIGCLWSLVSVATGMRMYSFWGY